MSGYTVEHALYDPRGLEGGQVIVVADSAQIEARLVAWFAGQEDLLEIFRQGRDVYSEEGSQFFGRVISKKTDPDDRQLSKCMVLGLGYQMGWYNFSGQLLKGMMGTKPRQFTAEDASKLDLPLDKFFANDNHRARVEDMPSRLPIGERLVHCAVAEGLVKRYRKKNDKIVDLWNHCEEALQVMEPDLDQDPHRIRATFGPGGCLKIKRHAIVLPNGMALKYPGLRESTDGGGYSYMGGYAGKVRSHIYGGSLTENIIQALARIIVAEQSLIISARYPNVTLTHDEVVAAAPAAYGQVALDYMIETMRRTPVWAEGLPLNAEGGFGKSYGEAK